MTKANILILDGHSRSSAIRKANEAREHGRQIEEFLNERSRQLGTPLPAEFKSVAQRLKTRSEADFGFAKLADLLRVYLGREGYTTQVIQATQFSGLSWPAEPPDLLILIIDTEPTEAFELVARIREATPPCKWIVYSDAGLLEHLLEEAHRRGADGFVSTVLPLDELRLAVERALSPRVEEAQPPSGEVLQTTTADDGKETFYRIFVGSQFISPQDFAAAWSAQDDSLSAEGILVPFIQIVADKHLIPIETSIQLIVEQRRTPFVALDRYDIDPALARAFPAATLKRWCILPFDRMSKSLCVVTANPVNKRAELDLQQTTKQRVIWYLATPMEIMKGLVNVLG
jgi:hypothetical protein